MEFKTFEIGYGIQATPRISFSRLWNFIPKSKENLLGPSDSPKLAKIKTKYPICRRIGTLRSPEIGDGIHFIKYGRGMKFIFLARMPLDFYIGAHGRGSRLVGEPAVGPIFFRIFHFWTLRWL